MTMSLSAFKCRYCVICCSKHNWVKIWMFFENIHLVCLKTNTNEGYIVSVHVHYVYKYMYVGTHKCRFEQCVNYIITIRFYRVFNWKPFEKLISLAFSPLTSPLNIVFDLKLKYFGQLILWSNYACWLVEH